MRELVILALAAMMEVYTVWMLSAKQLIPHEAYWCIAGTVILAVVMVGVSTLHRVAVFFEGGRK